MRNLRIFVRLAILFMVVYSFVGTLQLQMESKQIQLRKPDAPVGFEYAGIELPEITIGE